MRRTILALAASIATLSSAKAMIGTVEADNGAVYRIEALEVPYDPQYPITAEVHDNDGQLVIFTFDCKGHFMERVGFDGSGWRNVPSRSVVGGIAKIACYQAKR